MLVTVNLFLLVLVLFRDWKSAQYTESARTEAVMILEQNGISLDRDLLPDEMELRTLTVTRDPEAETAQAEALLGALSSDISDSTAYRGVKGTAQFYPNGEFSAQLEPGAYPLNGATPQSHALSVLAKMGFAAQLLEVADDGSWVRVCQLWEDMPIFTCEATLVYEDGALRAIRSGSYRLTGTPQSAGGDAPMTVTTALLQFWASLTERGEICNEITGMTPGYVLDAQTDPAVLTPAWLITTDTGSYYLDAITGESERRSEAGL